MAITDKFIPGVHVRPETPINILPANTAAGAVMAYDKSGNLNDKVGVALSATGFYILNPANNASYQQIASPTLSGTFGAGNASCMKPISAPGGNINISCSATGSTSILKTALTVKNADAAVGKRFRVVSGTGKGCEGVIKRVTLGANAEFEITPDAVNAAVFDATTKFRLWGGSWWYLNAGAIGANTFNCYDFLTGVWTARSQTNLPATIGTDSFLISCGSAVGSEGVPFTDGVVGSATTTTITPDTATFNKWLGATGANWNKMQLRITNNAQKGETVAITAYNTATGQMTFAAMAGAPAAGDTFVIEGNDDAFIYGGSAALALYEYSSINNAWTAITITGTARAGAPAAGCAAVAWIDDCEAWKEAGGNAYKPHYSTTIIKQNGRYIYNLRGGGVGTIDVFDRALNSWINALPYGLDGAETFTTGTCSADQDGQWFIQKDATGRFFRFDVNENLLEPFHRTQALQSTAIVSTRMAMIKFRDSANQKVSKWKLFHVPATGNTITTMWMV